MISVIRQNFWKQFCQYGYEKEFQKKGKCAYRIYYDIVQGFELFKQPRSPLVTVRWSIYPLCQPDANFYTDFYQKYDINDIIGKSIFDVYYNKLDPHSAIECADKVSRQVEEVLLPYFDSIKGSAMAYDAYVKMDFSKGGEDYPCMEKIYFALKSEMYEKAYQYVSRIIENNEQAVKNNAQYFSEEQMEQMRKKFEKKDKELQDLAEYIQYEERSTIQRQLKRNEEDAYRFLRKH